MLRQKSKVTEALRRERRGSEIPKNVMLNL